MKIIRKITQFGQLPERCVLTVGNFDGVHIGHQQIVAVGLQTAAERKSRLAVMTFEPHPVAILHPDRAPGVLTPLEYKAHLLAEAGVDYLIVLKDTAGLLKLSPADFVDKFLVSDIKPAVIAEGDDFNFGAGRAGNIDTLRKMAAENGFELVVVPARLAQLATGQTVRVSSTTIRYMLEAGHTADAAELLGRPYILAERIIPGRGRGKQLGFPTLNLKIPHQVIPAEGVYAGRVRLGDDLGHTFDAKRSFKAVFSIGQARTFGDEHPLLIEAHLLENKIPETSGKWMAMEFVRRIRSQHKFKTPDDLARQIASDCEKAEEILNRAAHKPSHNGNRSC